MSPDRRSRALSAGDTAALAELFRELSRFETELWSAVDAALRAEHGLPLSRFEPMQVIARAGRCRVYDICSNLSLTTGGASKLIDTIESSGHCRRKPNPDDRRSSLIELTPAGKRLVDRATVTFERTLGDRLGGALAPRSLEQFTASIRMLRAAAAAAEEPGG